MRCMFLTFVFSLKNVNRDLISKCNFEDLFNFYGENIFLKKYKTYSDKCPNLGLFNGVPFEAI